MTFVRPKPYLERVWRMPHSVATREGMELMDRNERTIDFPPAVMQDLRERITPFVLRAYPEPGALYDKLASWLKLPKEMVLLTMAADGGLKAIFEVFVEPGDEVISVSPSYLMYPVYCGMYGAVSQEVQFDDAHTLSIERIVERISEKTKLVVLANPNQPIERVYDDAEVHALLEACVKHDALLVMDEAYHHFCPKTAVPFLQEYGNLVVVRTFSKAFGIAGVRLGYTISRPENIVHLSKIRPIYEVHSLAIAIGMYLLDHDGLMTSYVTEVKGTMAFLVEAFRRMGFPASGQWSNSILVPLPADLPGKEIAEALKRRRFLIRAESKAPLSNHLRITVGTREQAQRFLSAVEDVLAERKAQAVSR